MSFVLLIVGVALGAACSWYVTRRFIHRPRLSFRLEVAAALITEELNLHDQMEIVIGGKAYKNLWALDLTIRNEGRADIVIPDASSAAQPGSTPQPRLDFHGVTLITMKTLNNDLSRFYVPCGLKPDRLHIIVHRIRARTSARLQLLATLDPGKAALRPEDVRFFPGALPNVDCTSSGLIHRPWLKK